MAGFERLRFTLLVDGRLSVHPRATDVVVVNGRPPGEEFVRPGLDCRLDDGELRSYVLRAGSLFDYARVVRRLVSGGEREDPRVHSLVVRESVHISSRRPVLVQGDGDAIGETPVEVRLAPWALKVVVPAALSESAARVCPPREG